MTFHEHTFLKDTDKEVYEALVGEERRQTEGLELIPSENYISKAVLEAMGSVVNNKYSRSFLRQAL